MEKKMCLSRTNKIVAGVCGGIAEYFDVDATFIRIIWVMLTIMLSIAAPTAVLLYIVCWAIMPLNEK